MKYYDGFGILFIFTRKIGWGREVHFRYKKNNTHLRLDAYNLISKIDLFPHKCNIICHVLPEPRDKKTANQSLTNPAIFTFKTGKIGENGEPRIRSQKILKRKETRITKETMDLSMFIFGFTIFSLLIGIKASYSINNHYSIVLFNVLFYIRLRLFAWGFVLSSEFELIIFSLEFFFCICRWSYVYFCLPTNVKFLANLSRVAMHTR